MAGSISVSELLGVSGRDALIREAHTRTREALAVADLALRPLVQYQTNPAGFCTEILGIPERTLRWALNPGYADHAWDGTPEPLLAMLEGLAAWDDVGVEAGTGTQKSYTAAAVILWFLGSWENARVFTFAPKEDQLRLFIWTEIKKLWPVFQARFPSAELTDLCLRVRGGTDDTWSARGYAVGVKAGEQTSTKAQGMHAEHMLLVYEEMPGIPPSVVESGENTSTAPHNIRLGLGNPDHQLDTLHLFCTAPGVRHIVISALDHPNVVTGQEIVPGAASRKSERRRRAKYGREGRLYKSRIRGISPAEAADALIKLEWVEIAQTRYGDPIMRMGKAALGVDVANSEDGDDAAIARGKGRCLLSVEAKPCPNANDLGFRIGKEMEADELDDLHVGVDSVGVGAGCVNELLRLEHFVQALNGGAAAEDSALDEAFNNLRSQMHWQLREDLRLGEIALPPNDPELVEDLITARWTPKNGKICVESKEDIKKRLPNGRSPNKGDAAVYWNWVRDRDPIADDVRRKRQLARGEAFPDPAIVQRNVEQELWQDALAEAPDEDDYTDEAHPYGDVVQEG